MMSRRNAIACAHSDGAVGPGTAFDCKTAFRRIADDALAAIRTQHAKACVGNAEAIHQIRVALTRLRAARAFFAAIATDAAWRDLKEEIGWLHRRLGAVRDCDVMRRYARRKAFRDWAARAGIQGSLEEARHRRRLATALRSARYRNLMVALAAWVAAGPWLARPDAASRARRSEPLPTYAEKKLQRWRGRIARKGRDLGRLGDRARHDLRIEAKRYRYMVDALSALDPALRDAWQDSGLLARRVQRSLGDLRDLQRFRKLGGKRAKLPGYKQAKRRLLRHAGAALRRL